MYVNENIHMRLVLISQLINYILNKLESEEQINDEILEALTLEMKQVTNKM